MEISCRCSSGGNACSQPCSEPATSPLSRLFGVTAKLCAYTCQAPQRKADRLLMPPGACTMETERQLSAWASFSLAHSAPALSLPATGAAGWDSVVGTNLQTQRLSLEVCASHYTHVSSLNLQNEHGFVTITVHISPLMALRLGEVKELAPGHPAEKWQRWDFEAQPIY